MRATLLFVVSLSLLLSSCNIEIENPFPDSHSFTETNYTWYTPGTYVDERLVAYMEDVFLRYVPASEKKFSDLAVEFTALAPRPEVTPSVSASAVNPRDPLPPNRPPTTPWWDSVPGWRLESPNKVVISFYYDVWELESVLGAAFSAFAADQSTEPPIPADIMVSDALKKRLAHLWDETKICTGYSAGEVTDLAIYLMPPKFFCEVNGGQMCDGYYTSPNTVLIGDREWVSKHEFIHYILWKNTGNADGAHASPLFQDCTQ